MKYHNYKSETHPVHEDIKPIISALKHGRKRLAILRFQSLCVNRNVVRWESLAIGDLIRKACVVQNIEL